MRGRKLIFITTLMITVFGLEVSCERKKSVSVNAEDRIVKPVTAFKVEKRTVEAKILVMGNVKGWRETDVFSKVPGKLLRYLVKEGDWVKVDEPLALIDQDLTGVRYKPAVIKAPVEGEIAILYLDPGETVTPPTMSRTMGVPVARIVDARKVRILMRVPDRFAGQVKPGMKVEVKLREGGEWIRRGRIVRIQPVIDEKSRTFGAEALLNNSDKLLVPGMFLKVRIIAKVKKGAFVVHKDAIVRRNGGFVVMKIKGGVVEEIPVKKGIMDEPYVEVNGSLSPGDYVILSGPSLLHSGEKVKVVEVVNR